MLSIPERVPPEKKAVLRGILESLTSLDGVLAVVLGGSYASGTHHAHSDLDIGIYYTESAPFSVNAIQALARRWSTEGAPVVTGFGDWGPWMNGGAWLQTAAGKVDLLYRNVEQVERTIEEAWAGVYRHDYDQQPTFGFYSTIYLGEIHVCIPLFDPRGLLARLKGQVETYPPPLRRSVVAQELWNAEFALSFAASFAAAGDTYNTAGCIARVAGYMTQALLALNQAYFMGDKHALKALAEFPLCPPDYPSKISRLLGRPGTEAVQLQESVEALRHLWSEAVDLAGDLYVPQFVLPGPGQA